MFCGKCGSFNEDSASFCVGCGADLQKTAPEAAPAPVEAPEAAPVFTPAPDLGAAPEVAPAAPVEAAPEYVPTAAPAFVPTATPAPAQKFQLNKLLKFIIPAGAVLLTLIILLVAGVFKPGDKKAIEKYFNSIAKGDGKAEYEVSVNPYQLESMLSLSYYGYDTKNDVIDDYIEDAEDNLDDLEDEFGKNLKVKIEFRKVKKYTKKEIRAINEYIYDEYSSIYYDSNPIQDIRVYTISATISGTRDSDTDKDEMIVYKMKGKWYVNSIAGLYDTDDIEEVLDDYM